MNRLPLLGALLLVAGATAAADDPDITGQTDPLSRYLIDTGAGSVSAAGMLGISGDSITNVQSVKDVVVAVQGLSGGNARPTIGIAITPARTSLTPMRVQNYAASALNRWLGSLTFSYAQGNAQIDGIDYQRRAVSIESNYFFHSADDPILAHAAALRRNEAICAMAPPSAPQGSPGDWVTATAGSTAIKATPITDPAFNKALLERQALCRENALKDIKWNASQMTVSVASGRIKQEDGGGAERSLGTTFAVGVSVGMAPFGDDQHGTLSSLSFTGRRTQHEPVLETLSTPQVEERDTSLMALRYTIGSNKVRALIEASSAKSRQITASQRAFKQAIGLDVNLAEGMWLNLRVGRQRKIDGTGDETASLFTINASPLALLQLR